MIILALVHHAHTPPPPFDANFFIVTATVIPVLFLAITIQGTMFNRWADAAFNPRELPDIPPKIQAAAVMMMRLLLIYILLAGTLGETFAIYALYQQQVGPVTQQMVLVLTFILIIATATGPAGAIIMSGITIQHRKAKTPTVSEASQRP